MRFDPIEIDDLGGELVIHTTGTALTLGRHEIRVAARVGGAAELHREKLAHRTAWRRDDESADRVTLRGDEREVVVRVDGAVTLDGGAPIHPLPCRPADPDLGRLRVAHEGRWRAPHPADDIIDDAARNAQVFCLHAYFWKDAPRALRPRLSRYRFRPNPWRAARHEPLDPDEFERVREGVQGRGMKLVVYMSPYYSSAPDFLAEVERVLEEYGVDGVYLDGVSDDAAEYDRIIRGVRGVLGEDRILYLNATTQPFGTPRRRATWADTWADLVLRGDSGRGGMRLEPFLREAVRGWGIDGTVGMWCHYGSWGGPFPWDRAPGEKHVRAALRNHVRIWRRSHWGPKALARFDRIYEEELEELLLRESEGRPVP